MKRAIMFVAIIVLIFALPMNAFADSNLIYEENEVMLRSDGLKSIQASFKPHIVSKTISEYDMLCELREKTDYELEASGFNGEEIEKIKAPLNARETYGNVTYTISYSKMYQSGGKTYLNTKMTWDWSSEPSVLSTDIVAMTTSEAFTKDSAAVTINYYLYGNKNSTKTSETGTVKTENSGRGVFARITMGKEWDTINKKYKKVALSGTMTTNWSISGNYSQAGISSNYGHSVITATPSVSFGAGASISFTPGLSCRYGDEAYTKAYLT